MEETLVAVSSIIRQHFDLLYTSSLSHLEEIVQDPRVLPCPPLALELSLATPRPKPLTEELLQAVTRGAGDVLHATLVRQEHLSQALGAQGERDVSSYGRMDESEPQLASERLAQPWGVVEHHVLGFAEYAALCGQENNPASDLLLAQARHQFRHAHGELQVRGAEHLPLHLVVQVGADPYVVIDAESLSDVKVAKHRLEHLLLGWDLEQVRSRVLGRLERHPVAAHYAVSYKEPPLAPQHDLDLLHNR
mmetsp:Transcript_18718/g.38291  ORF Transcript_18718/g.38291 Transcript_18718/m.38291 type:complete len:249 (-) Transcript_18718:8226-8972(-)